MGKQRAEIASSSVLLQRQMRLQMKQSPKERFFATYTVRQKLGEGADGVVYACLHKITAKSCAVKMSKHGAAGLGHEIQMMRQMNGLKPHVVQILDVFQESSFCCMVMEKNLCLPNAPTSFQARAM